MQHQTSARGARLAAAGLAIALSAPAAQDAAALRSFRPGEIWPDDQGVHVNAHGGGVLWHDGRYYWFGEHKIAGGAGNVAHVGVHVYSSRDLYNWKDEGIALRVSDNPTNDIARGCILERPKVIRHAKTGKFVMWFHLEPKGLGYRGARSGVAVSDTVAGPYRFLASHRNDAEAWPENATADLRRPLSEQETALLRRHRFSGGEWPPGTVDLIFRRDFAGGQMARDMTLFVDDDAKAYLVAASEENGTLHLSQLTDDYLETSGRYVRLFPGEFHEAPALFKRKGKYYLISSGCTGWTPNAARSAVADSIWGPYTPLGNPCRGTDKQNATTFESQSTFVLPVAGRRDAFIFMADRWRPVNAIDGRYVWLPIEWEGDRPVLRWRDEWDLSVFAP